MVIVNCTGSLKGQVWLLEGVSNVAGSGASTGLPLVLSQRGQASQGVALGGSCHSVLGPGAAGWAGEERPPAKYGKGAKI